MVQISTRLLESRKRNKMEFYIYDLKAKAGNSVIDAHWHNDLEILCTECDGAIELDTKTFEFKKNSFVFVNKAQLHPVTAYSDGEIFAIVFDLDFLDFKNDDFCQTEIIDALKNKTYLFPQFMDLDKSLREEITAVLKNTVSLYYSDIPGKELKIKCNLYEIIFLLYANKKFILSKEDNYGSAQLNYVKETVTFMENNYSQHVTIDGLAKNINTSKYYLIKIFKQITGETPIIYLRNLRLDISKTILEEGFSVTQTALMSGFQNVSYYIRHFKSRNSVTPKEYQRIKT